MTDSCVATHDNNANQPFAADSCARSAAGAVRSVQFC